VDARSHARTIIIVGAIFCAPAAALAHGQHGQVSGLSGHASTGRPLTLHTGVSVPLGPHARGAEQGAHGPEGTPGRLIEGISNPHGPEIAPVPTPSSDFDPLKRRRIALPVPAPAYQEI
jgi:hypothetical protein